MTKCKNCFFINSRKEASCYFYLFIFFYEFFSDFIKKYIFLCSVYLITRMNHTAFFISCLYNLSRFFSFSNSILILLTHFLITKLHNVLTVNIFCQFIRYRSLSYTYYFAYTYTAMLWSKRRKHISPCFLFLLVWNSCFSFKISLCKSVSVINLSKFLYIIVKFFMMNFNISFIFVLAKFSIKIDIFSK